jgi:hypothetical protein
VSELGHREHEDEIEEKLDEAYAVALFCLRIA